MSVYYEYYGWEGMVDKIITCGTPYEGAPYLINAVTNRAILETQDDQDLTDKLIEFLLATWGGLSTDVKSSFPGVAELLPTKNYVSEIPMWQKAENDEEDDYELTYDEYAAICEDIFGDENFASVVSFQNLLNETYGTYGDYNVLLGYKNAYFAIGINQATITAVKFNSADDEVEERLYETDLEYDVLGDGTVPYLSASVMEMLENLPSKRYQTFTSTHDGLVTKSTCLDWICDILNSGESGVPGSVLNDVSYTVIRVDGDAEITLTCDGETLSSAECLATETFSFGRIDRIGENGEIKMVCLYGTEDCEIVMDGTDAGTVDFTIRHYDAKGELNSEETAEDIIVTAETVIYANVYGTDGLGLKIDKNGNGSVDAKLSLK